MRTLGLLCCLTILLRLPAQTTESELDPSIFDGTGRGGEEAAPPEEPAGGGGETPEEPGAPEPLPVPTAPPSGEGAGPESEKTPGPSEGAGGEEPPPEATPEPGGGGEEVSAETPEEEAPTAPPGIGAGSSRAGETFTPTEKIPPGQAVDFPWDI